MRCCGDSEILHEIARDNTRKLDNNLVSFSITKYFVKYLVIPATIHFLFNSVASEMILILILILTVGLLDCHRASFSQFWIAINLVIISVRLPRYFLRLNFQIASYLWVLNCQIASYYRCWIATERLILKCGLPQSFLFSRLNTK